MSSWFNPHFVVAALSGAVAALFLRSVLKLLGKLWAAVRPLAFYDCAEEARVGTLVAKNGRRVEDNGATNGQAWEHHFEENGPPHTLYGPYLNDFGRPGYYKVKVKIFGVGFDKSRDPVIELDVVQIGYAYKEQRIVIGQKIVRAKDLKASWVSKVLPWCSRYRKFSIICFAAGGGAYEYRAKVHKEFFNERQHTIRFDTVGVYFHVPGWEIF